ncbi:MAG: M23 family metallopeptidase [Dethiobacter sp.]|jgi:murein DD-endopeptidase MepM/ murein hydrolase activator NlpD|nr:MAG: M23 family metallopeptidase [Dethiobacter sp.]
MYFKKKRKAAPYSNLRSRLEEYSSLKERTRWHGDEEIDRELDSSFNFFPLSILKDMHNFLLFKITLALLAILIVLLFSFVKMPFTASILQKIQYVTTWKMDFMEVGRDVAPVIRKLWEGNLESSLERVVIAPGGNILPDKELKFIAPLEGELEKTFGLKFNSLLQKEEMFYGLVFSTPRGTYVRASAGGRVVGIGEHPSYGLYLLLEHPAGMETLYGYLWEVLVNEREEVKQGQNIARVGMAPQENKPALYFEVRAKGEPLDPLPLLVGGGN